MSKPIRYFPSRMHSEQRGSELLMVLSLAFISTSFSSLQSASWIRITLSRLSGVVDQPSALTLAEILSTMKDIHEKKDRDS